MTAHSGVLDVPLAVGSLIDIIANGLQVVYAATDYATTVLVPVLAFYLFWSAGERSRIQAFVLTAPVRRAARSLKRESFSTTEVDEAEATLRAHLSRVIKNPQISTNAVLTDMSSTFPESRQRLVVLQCLAKSAAMPERRSAISRLWSDQARLVTAALESVDTHLTKLTDLHPADAVSAVSELGRLVTAYTGAIIVSDGVDSRAGVLDSVVVWHTNRWSGPPEPHAFIQDNGGRGITGKATATPTAWGRRHVGHDEPLREELRTPGTDTHVLRAGDYDGRVLDLRAARPQLCGADRALVTVLETNESCYLVTESAVDYAGKHVETDLTDNDGSTRRFDLLGVETQSGGPGTRIAILATSLTLVTHAGPTPAVLLSRRSGNARNGIDVLSATAGGVFELGRGEDLGDVDEFGSPDPLASVLREAREELGLELERQSVTPVAVMLSNIRGRRKEPSAATDGQLGATVVFVAHVDYSLEDIGRSRGLYADWTKGRYELDGFHPLELEPPATRGAAAVSDAARAFVHELHDLAGEVDQNAVVSALYCGSTQYGSRAVADALRALERPWWSIGWTDEPEGPSTTRLVRLPRHIAPVHASEAWKSSNWPQPQADDQAGPR